MSLEPPAGESFPFIVRWYSVNVASPPQVERLGELGLALDRARRLAAHADIRSAEVVDDRGMRYAEFNMLWSVPEEYQ